MKHFRHSCAFIFLLFTSVITSKTQAQCAFTSTDGYRVTVEVRPLTIIAPTSCPYGYNYNVSLLYNVVISGSHIPASLYTLQGNLYCSGDANFFSLPKSGGTGTLTTGSNPYRTTTDCATATATTLGCGITKITIEGPGIPPQTSTCAANILAVNLVSFNGKIVNDNSVYLKWVSASENNNKSFTVERSTDANNWTAIRTMNGALNSSTPNQYDFTDENLATGMYYYRLLQTDATGGKTYSNIIGANITKGAASKDITVSPNPNPTNQIYLSALGNAADWEMTIANIAGSTVVPTIALRAASVQLPQLSAGVYIIKLRNKSTGAQKALKFVKI